MPKVFPQVFITGVLLFLLMGAGYGITQAARAIPWDCADWQAFAHDDRTTAILESLAENRGKTLYCGIDQSDTFAKAETWEAGRDRNERDDTVYQGERGRFRGFLASQEGWLTEGESGVTGVSRDRIFEFPREERKRRTIRRFVPADPSRVAEGPEGTPQNRNGDQSLNEANGTRHFAQWRYSQDNIGYGAPYDDRLDWEQLAKEAATAYCRSIGYSRARNVDYIHPEGFVTYSPGNAFSPVGYAYKRYPAQDPVETYTQAQSARLIRQYTATCEKKGPRR